MTIAKGRFTRYDFVAYDKLTTGLPGPLSRVFCGGHFEFFMYINLVPRE